MVKLPAGKPDKSLLAQLRDLRLGEDPLERDPDIREECRGVRGVAGDTEGGVPDEG